MDFKNQELFCPTCKAQFTLIFPMSCLMFAAVCQQFQLEHKACPETCSEEDATATVGGVR